VILCTDMPTQFDDLVYSASVIKVSPGYRYPVWIVDSGLGCLCRFQTGLPILGTMDVPSIFIGAFRASCVMLAVKLWLLFTEVVEVP